MQKDNGNNNKINQRLFDLETKIAELENQQPSSVSDERLDNKIIRLEKEIVKLRNKKILSNFDFWISYIVIFTAFLGSPQITSLVAITSLGYKIYINRQSTLKSGDKIKIILIIVVFFLGLTAIIYSIYLMNWDSKYIINMFPNFINNGWWSLGCFGIVTAIIFFAENNDIKKASHNKR